MCVKTLNFRYVCIFVGINFENNEFFINSKIYRFCNFRSARAIFLHANSHSQSFFSFCINFSQFLSFLFLFSPLFSRKQFSVNNFVFGRMNIFSHFYSFSLEEFCTKHFCSAKTSPIFHPVHCIFFLYFKIIIYTVYFPSSREKLWEQMNLILLIFMRIEIFSLSNVLLKIFSSQNIPASI